MFGFLFRRRGKSVVASESLSPGSSSWHLDEEEARADEVGVYVGDILSELTIDARARRIVWFDGRALSIDQLIERLHARHTQYSPEELSEAVVEWLLMNGSPEDKDGHGLTQEEMDEFEDLVGAWIDDYEEQGSVSPEA